MSCPCWRQLPLNMWWSFVVFWDHRPWLAACHSWYAICRRRALWCTVMRPVRWKRYWPCVMQVMHSCSAHKYLLRIRINWLADSLQRSRCLDRRRTSMLWKVSEGNFISILDFVLSIHFYICSHHAQLSCTAGRSYALHGSSTSTPDRDSHIRLEEPIASPVQSLSIWNPSAVHQVRVT